MQGEPLGNDSEDVCALERFLGELDELSFDFLPVIQDRLRRNDQFIVLGEEAEKGTDGLFIQKRLCPEGDHLDFFAENTFLHPAQCGAVFRMKIEEMGEGFNRPGCGFLAAERFWIFEAEVQDERIDA